MGRTQRLRTQPNDERGRRALKRAFADTSVLLGQAEGVPACVELRKEFDWITSHSHVLEAYCIIMGRFGTEQADHLLDHWLPFAVAVPSSAIRPAGEIRQRLRAMKKDCSYTDALGYGIAHALEIPLLIADEPFRGVPGVCHVELPKPAAPKKRP